MEVMREVGRVMDDNDVSFFSVARYNFHESGSVVTHIAFQLMFSSVSIFSIGLRAVLACSALPDSRPVVVDNYEFE
jgi:hypothetical protein